MTAITLNRTCRRWRRKQSVIAEQMKKTLPPPLSPPAEEVYLRQVAREDRVILLGKYTVVRHTHHEVEKRRASQGRRRVVGENSTQWIRKKKPQLTANLPTHDFPSVVSICKPSRHEHSKDPGTLWQVSSQPPFSVSHSLMSVDERTRRSGGSN